MTESRISRRQAGRTTRVKTDADGTADYDDDDTREADVTAGLDKTKTRLRTMVILRDWANRTTTRTGIGRLDDDWKILAEWRNVNSVKRTLDEDGLM